MSKINYIILLILSLSFFACSKNEKFGPQTNQTDQAVTISNNAALLINEGNFGSNNGSLSYINLDSLNIANNVFYNRNNKYLGDIPQSINLMNDFIYIIVNHSAKMEIINAQDLSLVKTIEGFKSPRYMCFAGLSKAYISDLYSDSLAIFDLKSNSIRGYINIGRSSDKMLFHNNYVYVVNWSNYGNPGVENNQIVKIDVTNDQVINTIEVTKEPNSIVLDKNDKIWILCSGGYDNTVNPSLIRINPESNQVELKLVFQNISDSPTCLSINDTGDTLYFVNQGIFQMNISETLPQSKLIEENNYTFYNLAIHSADNKIIVCDTKNYSSQGQVHIYNTAGQLLKSLDTGIIPGDIIFN